MGQKINPNLFRSNSKNILRSKYQVNNKLKLSNFIYKETEIKKYIYQFFNYYKIILINCNIYQSEETFVIIIKYYTTKSFNSIYFNTKLINKSNSVYTEKMFFNNLLESLIHFLNKKSVKLIVQNVNKGKSLNFLGNIDKKVAFKKLIVQLRKYTKFSFYEECLNSLLILIQSKNASKLLGIFLVKQFETLKRHNLLLNFLKRALTLFLYSSISKIKGVKILIKGRLNGKPRSSHKLIHIGKVALQTVNSKVDYTCCTSFSSFGTFGIKVWVCEQNH